MYLFQYFRGSFFLIHDKQKLHQAIHVDIGINLVSQRTHFLNVNI